MSSPCFPSQVKKADVDKALTPERVSAIWKYAKANYIDKGANLEATLTGVSADTGLPREWVAQAFAKPKALRTVTNEAYKLQEQRRTVLQDAKNYVVTADTPGAIKLIATLTSVPRRVLTLGHGPVFPVTHALDLAGSEPAAYFKSVGNAWKFASKVEHAKAMDSLRNNDLYPDARKAGLVVKPEQGPQGILSGGSGSTSWARRSWDALKVTRMSLFEDRVNSLPASERTPEALKNIASQINHSTGAMSAGEWGFGTVGRGMFAPQLTASKIAKTVVDPVKTAVTYGKVMAGQEVPFAERNIANLRVKQATKAVASLAGLLAVNQGFLIASGDKDRVNFTDPSRGDWLRPKAFGHTLNLRGTSELIRLLGNVIAVSQMSKQDRRGDSKTDKVRDAVAKYAQYKLDPAVQLVGEAALQEDTFGRPLPFSSEQGSKSKPKYTVPEYVLSKGPIYLGGATKEIYDGLREHGLSAHDTMSLLRALKDNPEILAEGAAVGAGEFLGGGIQKSRPKK